MKAGGWRWVRALGLLLFAVILWHLDWAAMAAATARIDPRWLPAYAALWMLQAALKLLRLRVMLGRSGHALAWGECYRCTLEPSFWGAVTPGRLGEFARIALLGSAGVPLPTGTAFTLLERLSDLGVLLLAGLLVLGLTGLVDARSTILAVIAIAVAAAVTVPAARVLRDWRLGAWLPQIRDYPAALGAMARRDWGVLLFFSVAIQLLNAAAVGLLASMLGIATGFLYIALCYAASVVVTLVPVSVGGLGTREATYLALLQLQGVPAEQAVLLSLLDGTVLALALLALAMLPLWLRGLSGRRA